MKTRKCYNKRNFILGVVGSVLLMAYFYFYYIERESLKYLSALESELIVSKKVKLSEVFVDFDWEDVCILLPYKDKKLVNVDTSEIAKIPDVSELGRYYSAFVFVSNKKVVKVVELKKPYIRVGQMKPPYGFDGSRYHKDICMPYSSVYMEVKNFKRGPKVIIDNY